MIGKAIRSVLLLLLLVILGVLLFIHTPMFEAMVRQDIEERVSRATGEPLRVDELSVSPFRGHVRATGIRLSDILTVGAMDLDIKTLPLFLFRVEVVDAVVDDVAVQVTLHPDRTGFQTNPMELVQNGFDSLLLHHLKVTGLTIRIAGRDDLSVVAELPRFLLMAGFDGDRYAYDGAVAFTGGRVTVNGNPMLLDMGSRFAIHRDAMEIRELTIRRGTLQLSASGRWDADGLHLEATGTVPLKELTGLPEVQDTVAEFSVSGGLDGLTGPLTIRDPRGALSGNCTVNLEKKTVEIANLTGSFREHTVRLSGRYRFGSSGRAEGLLTVTGPILADFRAVLSAEKKDEWTWRAAISGHDCGKGNCRLEVVSGQRPVLHEARLNLPFLQTQITDNHGWLALKLDWADVRLTGDFFAGPWFSGQVAVNRLHWADMEMPRATGTLLLVDAETADVTDVTLTADGGTVQGDAQYRAGTLTLTAELQRFPFHEALFAVPETRDLAIDGRVSGRVSLSGELDNPTVTGDVLLEPLSLFDLAFDRASAGFRFENNVLTLDQPVIEGGVGHLGGSVVIDFNTDALAVHMNATNGRLVYRPLDFLSAWGCTGPVTATGTLDHPVVQADLRADRLLLEDTPLGSGDIRFRMDGEQLAVDVTTDRRLHAAVKAALDGRLAVSLAADQSPVVVNGVTGTGSFTFRCEGDFNRTESLRGEGEVAALTLDLPEAITLSAEPFPLTLTGLRLQTDQVFFHHPDLDMQLAGGGLDLASGELAGVITGSGTLAPFASLAKRETGLDVSGRMSWEIETGGTLVMPVWSGTVTLSEGQVTIPDLDRPVTNIAGTLTADAALLTVERVTGTYGPGTIRVTGIMADDNVGLEWSLDNIPVEQGGLFARLDGLVRLEGDPRADRLRLAGSVSLANGVINPAQLMLGSGGDDVPVFRHLTLDLNVATRDLEISDDTMRLVLDRSVLSLQGPAEHPIVLGIQRVARDSLIYLNDIPLRVTEGEIRFENQLEIDPTVDIRAETRIQEVTVRCRLVGSGSGVRLNLSSTPPLREQELMALLFGSGGMAATGQILTLAPVNDPAGDLAGAGAALALNNLFAPLKRRVQRRLGVERFSITPQIFDARSTPSPIVTFEKDVSSRLTGTYSQSLIGSGDNLLQFRYRMAGKRAIVARKEIDGSVTLELEFHTW